MTEAEYQSIKAAAPLEETQYSEHKRGEWIRYHVNGGEQVAEGEIIFVQAAGMIGSHHSPLVYLPCRKAPCLSQGDVRHA